MQVLMEQICPTLDWFVPTRVRSCQSRVEIPLFWNVCGCGVKQLFVVWINQIPPVAYKSVEFALVTYQ